MSASGQKMSNVKKFIIGLIAVCAVASAACFYIARTMYSEFYLMTAPQTRAPGKPHDLISFDQQGNLIGVSLKQGRFLVDRYQVEGGVEHAEVPVPGDPVQWMIGSDGVTLAWLSGINRVSVQRARFAAQSAALTPWPVAKTLVSPSDLVTFGVLKDGSIGLVLANGELIRKDPAGNEPDVKHALGAKIGWAQLHGDYAAATIGGKIRMYRLLNSEWKMIEERPDFEKAIERRLPAEGQIVALVAGGVRMGDQTLNTPGKVADVAMSDQGFVLASGAFKGIYSLPVASEAYMLADSPPGVQIAASRNALGYTGEAGTVIVPLIQRSRLNETGRMIVGIATALIILAILAALLLLYVDGKGLEPKSKRKDVRLKETKLPKPPPDLIKALSSGDATLWAGAGLSSTSGFPLRNAFISSVFQTALMENWQTAKQMDKYWKLVTDGKPEDALDQFVSNSPANRIRVGDLARSTYSRFSSVNPTQRILAKLPFKTAITTNYDTLLERTGSEWAINTARVAGGAHILALGSHLTVKLFGDFEGGGAVMLGREELRSTLEATPDFIKAFHDLFEARPILFVGASIEGLLEDLAMLNAPKAGVKHYCVAGVATLNWKPKANELKSRYNIEVFPCDVLSIQDQLKVFLTELQSEVEAQGLGGQSHPQMGIPVG